MSYERDSGEPTVDRRDRGRGKTGLDPDELSDARWMVGKPARITGDPQTKDIPILAMTALQLKSSVDTASRMQDYIVKPFPIDELQGKINAVIC